jgi:hypothetical protein
MQHRAPASRRISLCDLLLAGVVCEDDFDEQGHLVGYRSRRTVQVVAPSRPSSLPLDAPLDTHHCAICLTRRREVAAVPCGHFHFCNRCAIRVLTSTPSSCPICRARVTGTLRIFM